MEKEKKRILMPEIGLSGTNWVEISGVLNQVSLYCGLPCREGKCDESWRIESMSVQKLNFVVLISFTNLCFLQSCNKYSLVAYSVPDIWKLCFFS